MKTSPETYGRTDFLKHALPVESNPQLATHGDLSWFINDSPLSQYAEVRFPNYPGGLLQLLERHIGRNYDNIGLDLGGGNQGRALRDLFEAGILGQGLVTNLNDMRRRHALADTALGHVDGDLATEAVWNKIIDWQRRHAPNGLALVMHRPYGALQNQPSDVYVGAAHLLLDIIRPGGVLFSQIPLPLLDNPEEGRAAYRELYARPDVSKITIGESYPYSDDLRNCLVAIKAE